MKNVLEGHILGVAEQGLGWEDIKHIKHAPKSVFDMFDMKSGMRKMPNMTNMPLWMCLLGLV